MKSWVAAGAIVGVVGATAATGLVVAGTDEEPPATIDGLRRRMSP